MSEPYRIAALYRFTRFDAPETLRETLIERLSPLNLCGTLLVANEGLNGTIAGTPGAMTEAIDALRALPGCADMDVKYSDAKAAPFRRFKVRLKREIVTMGVPEADPSMCVGTYVPPEDWNALIRDPDTIVIDTRNDYEVGLGTFQRAINPETLSFRDFPHWFERQFSDHRPKQIAMFCTGGIRCEKATSFAKSIGISEVYHLKGGILKYLETVPEADSLWQGECFVFDERVSVTNGLAIGEARLCRACKYPVTPEDRLHPDYEAGVSCPRCITKTTPDQKARFRERQRQIALAKARGSPHLPGHDTTG